MPGRVKSSTITERVHQVVGIKQREEKCYLNNQLHRILDVIVEEKTAEGQAIGTSGNYMKVSVPMGHARKGGLLLAKITEASDNLLTGSLIS